ncbi:MAG: hypothetical protein ABR913_03840 [Sedimentisphaerales bacterium]|jgi:hypothetical protein
MKNLMFLAAWKSWMSHFPGLAVPRGLQKQFPISYAALVAAVLFQVAPAHADITDIYGTVTKSPTGMITSLTVPEAGGTYKLYWEIGNISISTLYVQLTPEPGSIVNQPVAGGGLDVQEDLSSRDTWDAPYNLANTVTQKGGGLFSAAKQEYVLGAQYPYSTLLGTLQFNTASIHGGNDYGIWDITPSFSVSLNSDMSNATKYNIVNPPPDNPHWRFILKINDVPVPAPSAVLLLVPGLAGVIGLMRKGLLK